MSSGASNATEVATKPPGWLSSIVRRNPLRTVALSGALLAYGYGKYQQKKEEMEVANDPSHSKKVLVLPFYKMKLVEESKRNFRSLLSNGSTSGDKSIEMPVDEVVNLIHKAAGDPDIVALYGVLGHGGGFSTGGWAHVEEIRNALLVFRQSHRIHHEPGKNPEDEKSRPPKPLFLYSNTFAAPTSGGGADMKEYYLASAFTKLHLQPQGDLNLFGLHTTNTFYRDFLARYGITVHVWKHGLYKNFANQFTHSYYTKEHGQNVANILQQINSHICHGIYFSRQNLKNYEYTPFWKMVSEAGSFPAEMAQKIGFVDFLPKLNPLDDLLEHNKATTEASDANETTTEATDDDDAAILVKKWDGATDLQGFPAHRQISITDYARELKEKKAKEARNGAFFTQVKEMPEAVQYIFGQLGFAPSSADIQDGSEDTKENIAVIKIYGPITDATARKLEKPLRLLKKSKETKALVLRVDSPGGVVTACETIHQQLQDLPQKVVVSFGNVSASGGYYISANSDRIFASPTTITGSIGVIMLRTDFRGLAKQWGVTFDSVSSSSLAGSFDPFYPMNSQMKENFANFTDRSYKHFKAVVSEGRQLDMDEVEKVAQGRVWTGTQAKDIGLVDELGGLDRAVAYCQRNFTQSGNAKVVAWPPKKSIFQAFVDSRKKGGDDDSDLDNVEIPSMLEVALAYVPGFLGLMHNDLADSMLSSPKETRRSFEEMLRSGDMPMVLTGAMMTMDENAAIQCLLEQHEVNDLLPGTKASNLTE